MALETNIKSLILFWDTFGFTSMYDNKLFQSFHIPFNGEYRRKVASTYYGGELAFISELKKELSEVFEINSYHMKGKYLIESYEFDWNEFKLENIDVVIDPEFKLHINDDLDIKIEDMKFLNNSDIVKKYMPNIPEDSEDFMELINQLEKFSDDVDAFGAGVDDFIIEDIDDIVMKKFGLYDSPYPDNIEIKNNLKFSKSPTNISEIKVRVKNLINFSDY